MTLDPQRDGEADAAPAAKQPVQDRVIDPNFAGRLALIELALRDPRGQPLSSVHEPQRRLLANARQAESAEKEGQWAPPPEVSVYSLPMKQLHPDLKAVYVLRANLGALMIARKVSQRELAQWCGHEKSWVNKILNGTRELLVKDLDRISEFFGLATYQLFQPGISSLTERRSGFERRVGKDRRISQQQRTALAVGSHLAEVRARPSPRLAGSPDAPQEPTPPAADSAIHAAADHIDRAAAVLRATATTRRQAATAGRARAVAPRRDQPHGRRRAPKARG